MNIKKELEAIRQLANVLEETNCSEVEIEKDNIKLKVAKFSGQQVVSTAVTPASNALVATAQGSGNSDDNTTELDPSNPNAVTSPMVGNAYLAPSPDEANFVKEGDSVEEGQTLLIVEAMKVMNYIPAHKGGIVKKILVQDSQPVEYNDVLAIIE